MAIRFPIALSLLLLASSALGSIHGGTPRELTPRTLDVAWSEQSGSRIASDGSSFLSVWSDHPGTILGARLAPDGTLIDTTPLTIGAAGSGERWPAVAWGNGRYFVAWQESFTTLRGRFVARDGTMSDVIELGTRPTYVAPEETYVAFNGRVFLVMWFWRDIVCQATVVEPSGRILASREIPVGFNTTSDLVAVQGTFYVVSSTFGEVLAIPIDESAGAGTRMTLAQPGLQVLGVRAAARAYDFLVAWWSPKDGANEIASVRVTAGGAGAIEMFASGEAPEPQRIPRWRGTATRSSSPASRRKTRFDCWASTAPATRASRMRPSQCRRARISRRSSWSRSASAFSFTGMTTAISSRR